MSLLCTPYLSREGSLGAKIIFFSPQKFCSFILTSRETCNCMAIFLAFYIKKKTHRKGEKQLKLSRIDEAKTAGESCRVEKRVEHSPSGPHASGDPFTLGAESASPASAGELNEQRLGQTPQDSGRAGI